MTHLAVRGLLLLAAAWLAAVFDLCIAPWLAVQHCAPSACLLAAAAAIALSESSYAFLTAGWFGLAADLSGVGSLGPALGCFAAVGYVVIAMRGASRLRGALRQGIELLAGTIAMAVSLSVIQALVSASDAALTPTLRLAAGAGLYTFALAAPLLLLAASARPMFPAPTPDA
jgi:hypothetical protein